MTSAKGITYVGKLREGTAFGTDGFNLDDLRRCMATRCPPTDAAVLCFQAGIGGVPGEWVVAKTADPDVRLLYLHGGGFVSGCPGFYLDMAARISAAAGCAVFLPDYRLAPEHPFPTAIEDCLLAYAALRATGPTGTAPAKATFIGGDSAGGGLTLAVLLALRDRGQPLPTGAMPISPFADCALSGDSIRSEGALDPIMHPSCLPHFVNLYLRDPADVRHPLASPVFGDYTGIPPLLIQVGEHEIIRDDSVRVAAKARLAGVDVTLEVWPDMFHVFQWHWPQVPEAQEAIEHIAAFIRVRIDCKGQ